MRRKAAVAAAAAGTVLVFALGGTFLVKNVFAAEQRVTVTKENPDALQASAGSAALKVFKNGIYKDKGCTFILPAGYIPEGDTKGKYVSERYPVDSSNIYYTVSDSLNTESLREALLSGKYEENAKKGFMEAYGAEAVLNSFNFESTQIDGSPAYMIRLSCTAQDTTVEQLICMIVADQTYTVTFSQSADDERMDDFEQSAKSIRIFF